METQKEKKSQLHTERERERKKIIKTAKMIRRNAKANSSD